MTSLVPYASSSEDEESTESPNGGSKSSKRKLEGFTGKIKDSKNSGNSVHTSLGIAAKLPLKGDWLCHVFIPVNQNNPIREIINDCNKILQDRDEKLERIDQPHISLTKPILIRYPEREDFIAKVKDVVDRKGLQSRFSIAFSGFTNLSSEDTSRVYYALEVAMGWQELHTLTDNLNKSLSSFHAREYFQEAVYHCSFASSSKSNSRTICNLLESKFGDKLRNCPPLHINQISIATGSQISNIQL